MNTPAITRLWHGSAAPCKLLLAAGLSLFLSACGGGGSGSSSSSSAAGTTGGTATPVVSISASPTSTTLGQVVSLTWSTANPASSTCTASGAWSGSKATSGSQSVTPTAVGTSSYVLTCGSVSNTASVVVSAATVAPTVSIALAPASVTVGTASQLTWSATNATACTASGAWSGSQATSGTLAVSQASAATYTYTLTCSGGGGTASGSANLAVNGGNSATIVVDNGPTGGGGNAINAPYVSVTVCQPGTSTCQTIDHVLVDTGSYGLRLIAPLNAALALPAVTTASGAPAGECAQFVSGYTWGAVRQADVRIGNEVASGIPVQVIGDTDSDYASTPSTCSSAGSNLGTVAALGANGILGIGLKLHDCGSACVSNAISGTYYACAGGSCSSSAMALASQVSNPVASFAVNNNGVMLVLPAVASGGATTLTGSLIFGVGTDTNNAMTTQTIYRANSRGYFSTTYNSKTYTSSFIDSGSNGLFFDDSTISSCASGNGFYCPSSTLSLSAVNAAYDGSASGTVAFTIENVNRLTSTTVAASIGGSATSGTAATSISNAFDWGLPFFYGRSVFVVFENATAGGVTGPYWAY